MFLIYDDRLTLPRRTKDTDPILIIFFKCISTSLFFSTYRYLGKHVEGNIKNNLYSTNKLTSKFYLHKIFERRPKDMWNSSLGDVHNMMFYGRPENVNLTHCTKFIILNFLKHSFGVQPGSKNN